MFVRSFASKDRATKATKSSKKSFSAKQKLFEQFDSRRLDPGGGLSSSMRRGGGGASSSAAASSPSKSPRTSPIITIVVGQDQRLFAAHEDILCRSPYFEQACRDQFFETNAKRLTLVDEEPETFSCVLEFLYKGDYTPRLLSDKRRHWYLEGLQDPNSHKGVQPTMYHSRVGDVILRDTAVYCAAERFGLEELKRLALRKQGLQCGIGIPTILRSARFAYDNTPEHDSALRAHYLALIIRSRKTFKRSGTMQTEMEMGGRIWWDLFCAMADHLDDVVSASSTPKTV